MSKRKMARRMRRLERNHRRDIMLLRAETTRRMIHMLARIAVANMEPEPTFTFQRYIVKDENTSTGPSGW